ncbi:MAG: hypothetical protein GX877_07165 [Bacteroidales bacterium]|nr:hypothetical protein [Bacteroidales bacterium]
MNIILSTPGQWYLEYLDNGLWAALESMGFPMWGIIGSLIAVVLILALAIFVPFPKG